MYRRSVNTFLSPRQEIFLEGLEGYRFYVYLILFGLSQLYGLSRWRVQRNQEDLEFQILEKSFAVEENTIS